MQVDEVVNDFLMYKGLIEPPQRRRNSGILTSPTQAGSAQHASPDQPGRDEPSPEPHVPKRAFRRGKNYEMEKLLATVEVLSIKIESNHLQRVIMSWIYGGG